MATIQKRTQSDGSVRYRVMVRRKGHPVRSATFAQAAEAKLWATRIEAETTPRQPVAAHRATAHTLADLLDRHLEALRLKRPHAWPKQKQLLGWWREQLGACPLAQLTPAHISDTRDRLLVDNPGTRTSKARRSGATVNRYLAALSSACANAVREWHWMAENPVLQVAKAREKQGRIRYLSPDEKDTLLIACGASPLGELELIVTLALTTGMRRSEIRALHWSDIDLKHGVLVLRPTGLGKGRKVRIAPQALALLGKHGQTSHTRAELVFPRGRSGLPLDFDHAFIAAVRAAGIADFRFHDLRHTTAIYLGLAGASDAEIAAMLGYRTLTMAQRYRGIAKKHTDSDIKRMTAIFFR